MSIYHYTDLNAVKSIIESSKLRLTDSRYLNDIKELSDGFSYIYEAIEKNNWSKSLIAQKVQAINFIKNSMHEYLNYGTEEESVFVCSFSNVPDLLSQWRSYGMFAIEFEEQDLKSDDFNLSVCTYSKDDKHNKSKLAVNNAIIGLEKFAINNNGQIFGDAYDFVSNLVEIAATFKDSGFSEESEVRHFRILENTDASVKYRIKDNVLIPYLEKEFFLPAIKAIHVGPVPNRELVINSLEQYIRFIWSQHEAKWGWSEHQIEIIESSIPYRG